MRLSKRRVEEVALHILRKKEKQPSKKMTAKQYKQWFKSSVLRSNIIR